MERLLRFYRVSSSPIAVAFLVAVNLLPLVGAVLWGWDVWSLLILYWVENGIVGAFNVLRMLTASGPLDTRAGTPELVGFTARATLIPFFIVHYGLFWIVHGVFVFGLPSFAAMGSAGADIPMEPRWDLIGFGAIALAISHGASYVLNYLGRGEYRTARLGLLMFGPYPRLVILHMTILIGGFLSIAMGSPIGSMVVLVVLKTALDLALHLREHRGAAQRATAATPPIVA